MKSVLYILAAVVSLAFAVVSCGDGGFNSLRTLECAADTECPSDHSCSQSRCMQLKR